MVCLIGGENREEEEEKGLFLGQFIAFEEEMACPSLHNVVIN